MLQHDNVSTRGPAKPRGVRAQIIQRIASFFFDLPEGGTSPSAVFVVFDMAGQTSSISCPVKLSSTAIETA